jgi:hypothetical protein
MWIRELATGWERVYKPSEHASASVTRGTRDAVPTIFFPPHTSKESKRYSRNQQPHPPLILRLSRSPQACPLLPHTNTKKTTRSPTSPQFLAQLPPTSCVTTNFDFFTEPVKPQNDCKRVQNTSHAPKQSTQQR